MAVPLRVLIAEDSPADAELIVAQLRRAGFAPQWTRVESEPDFLRELAGQPDIVLSDYAMPQFSGLRAAQLTRESGWNIHAERGDTLAGLVFNQLGRAPRRWESVTLSGYEIVVVDVSGSRISQVRIRRLEEDAEDRAEA